MTVVAFASTFNPILKTDGTINSLGTIQFYEVDTVTPKLVYSDKNLTVSLGSLVTLLSDGTKGIFLSGDYDCVIKDSLGSTIRTLENINPDTSGSSNINNLIPNGNFEDVSNNLPTNWTLFEWNTGQNVIDTVDPSNGARCMKFVSIGGGGGYVTSSYFEVDPTTYLTIGFSLKSSVATVRNIVQLLWYNKSKTFLTGVSIYDNALTNPTSWTSTKLLVTPNESPFLSTSVATVRFAQLRLIGADSSNVVAGTVRYDNVQVLVNTASPTTNDFVITPRAGVGFYVLNVYGMAIAAQKGLF